MRCARAVVVCVLVTSCSPHPVTVFPRAADVSPGQEVVAAITDQGVVELSQHATVGEARVAPDDLVVVRATDGQIFGPISVHAKRPALVPAGWAVIIVGTIASIAATTIAIASTDPNAFFATRTDVVAGALGLAGFAASVTLGGFLIYAGSNPLVITDTSGRR